MGKNFLSAFIVLLIGGVTANVLACTCGETTVGESKSNAKTVFLGRIKNKVRSEAVGKNGVEITFEVERVWKGRLQKT